VFYFLFLCLLGETSGKWKTQLMHFYYDFPSETLFTEYLYYRLYTSSSYLSLVSLSRYFDIYIYIYKEREREICKVITTRERKRDLKRAATKKTSGKEDGGVSKRERERERETGVTRGNVRARERKRDFCETYTHGHPFVISKTLYLFARTRDRFIFSGKRSIVYRRIEQRRKRTNGKGVQMEEASWTRDFCSDSRRDWYDESNESAHQE